MNEDPLEEEAIDAMLNTIQGVFASRDETMASRMRHVKEAEVVVVGTVDFKNLNQPDIMFTKHDAEGMHFLHDDGFIVKLMR